MLKYRSDLVARSPQGNIIAVVEIKNARNLPPQYAESLIQQALREGDVPCARYFMVVSQDVGYLWSDVCPGAETAIAPLQFRMAPIIARYTSIEGDRRLSEFELTLRVQHWLTDLSLHTPNTPISHEEPENALESVGFVRAIHDATIATDAGL